MKSKTFDKIYEDLISEQTSSLSTAMLRRVEDYFKKTGFVPAEQDSTDQIARFLYSNGLLLVEVCIKQTGLNGLVVEGKVKAKVRAERENGIQIFVSDRSDVQSEELLGVAKAVVGDLSSYCTKLGADLGVFWEKSSFGSFR